jgi:hypothetical protein
MFFIIINAVRVAGGISGHHQELIKFYMQPWVLSCFLPSTAGVVHTSGRQQESTTIPKAAHTVL